MNLQESYFTVQHRRGTENANADTLSRFRPKISSDRSTPPVQTTASNSICLVQLTSDCNVQQEQQQNAVLVAGEVSCTCWAKI